MTELARARGERILLAHMLLAQALNERVSLATFGKLVAAEESRLRALRGADALTPYSASSISRWESGEAEPTSTTFLAISRVLAKHHVEADPGWLAYGEESGAPGPKHRAITLDMVARARGGRSRG